ncbi:uncharacterized protein B0H18DRAFT_976789 [Fomitopsis serialis]|uniref:uncharacterized protein n=1 Tax=Fomitopsis serialis TaxID=139415 RepID=UPI00200847F7|nr:uncharacterized protein B0H18DRAFT_976789 [Neoantrodia serialis]KAH9935676.1 hypothetical protein B0H18DRAFT_976789 [Neoantrodia serialis]
MDNEPGDEYTRRIATYIRTHEQGLAAAAIPRRRRGKPAAAEPSVFNPLGWFASDNAAPSTAKPVILSFDIHHLFYLLMRLEALGIDVGSLDVQVDSPSRPMNYINIFPSSDKSDALSLMSFRSSLSVVSKLSLGAGWFRTPPPTLDAELKYIYSSFTKLPALSLRAPEAKLIAELATEAPNENALPMDAFKCLQTLQCIDIDPRTLLGWDRLAESLLSLSIKNSGLEDVSDIFIGAVLDDQARREGRVKDSRTRRLPRSLSRPQSFYGGSRLPESVPEDAEEEEDGSPQSTTQPIELPSLKWAFLRHLSLADNALTFLPTSPLPYLTSLTHLDLSSNLLVSVPPGLQSLYNLTSLNLSDNMIDSVLGIYTVLGQVLYLNLSKNRLESICGLERLLALERVDLRHNIIEESAEVGRLAALPNITEVWIEGNPFTEIEEGYRIRCFDHFTKEGKSVLLDGASPSFYEKMYLTSPPSQQMTSSRPPSVAYTPPVVAVGSPVRNGASPMTASPQQGPSSHSSPPSNGASPHIAAVNARGRRKKNKRIVDLDGDHSMSDAGSSRTASQARVGSEVGGRADKTRSPKSAKAPLPSAPEPSAPAGPRVGGDLSIYPAAAPVAPAVVRPTPKTRHSRNHTEHAPSSFATSDDTDNALQRGGSLRKAGTMSRSAKRRSRVSASMYQPAADSAEEAGQFKEADAFRARIEALRSDMGDGWLKVFNQSQLSSPPPTGVPSG